MKNNLLATTKDVFNASQVDGLVCLEEIFSGWAKGTLGQMSMFLLSYLGEIVGCLLGGCQQKRHTGVAWFSLPADVLTDETLALSSPNCARPLEINGWGEEFCC